MQTCKYTDFGLCVKTELLKRGWEQKHLEELERCSKPVPVLDMTGESIGEYAFDSKGALRALELLGKHLGMFEDRLKVAAKVDTGKLDGILAQLRGGPPDG